MTICSDTWFALNATHWWSPPFKSRFFCWSLLNARTFSLICSWDTALLVNLEILWPHWDLCTTCSIEISLSRRNNKNSSQTFIRRIVMWALRVKVMAEIQRRIRFNTITMSVLMITIAVGVMTAMWMYADALVWFLTTSMGDTGSLLTSSFSFVVLIWCLLFASIKVNDWWIGWCLIFDGSELSALILQICPLLLIHRSCFLMAFGLFVVFEQP